MQHATGLFDKIPKSSDSKDIEAWIAERKKRYPTKERVDSLEAEKQEKISRGEVLGDPTTQPKLSSTPKDIRSNKTTTPKSGLRNGVKRPMNQREPKRPPRFFMGNLKIEIIDGLPPDYETNKKAAIEAAASAAAVQEEPAVEPNISDEEWETESPLGKTSKNMCSVLSALSAAYDSTISDEDEPPVEVNTVVSKVGDELPIDDSLNSKDSSLSERRPETASEKNPRKRARKRPTKEDNKRPRKALPPPPSLLQKLLVKEIRKERNQILQCVRYIVENNYLEPSTDVPAKSAVTVNECD